MQTLATYVNEMQRIYEEYGSELDQLAKSNVWAVVKNEPIYYFI